MKWTSEQREAIEKRGQNILLAAAAGSGKTAVLVQRIIELISNPKSNVNINELLVLTFTDAAAREMREKIADAIQKALAQNPGDEHLEKQKLLLYSANISTIHSFCLNMLKSNIHLTDLPVDFSLISETENKILLSETLDSVLERFYGKITRDPSIAQLVMGYGGIKNDRALRDTVLKLFYFSKSMAYPERWLNEAIREYKKVSKSMSLEGGMWLNSLKKIVSDSKNDILDIYNDILAETKNKLSQDHPYTAFFSDEAVSIRRCFEHMSGQGYCDMRDAIMSFSFARLTPGQRGAEGEVLASQEKIKSLRELAKGIINDLKELFKTEEAQLIERITKTYPAIRTLKNIVLMLNRSYTKRKREKSFLDFSDLEHEALSLLVGKDGKPTEVAERLRERYKEILIDEYQDTNDIQDTLFKSLSGDNGNIFMVGDLKQSIYTFRNAVPKLFSDKYVEYEKAEGKGHLIRLFKNFRSRGQVVNAVNFIFSSIMSADVGDINYIQDEYLIKGAQYPETDDDSDFSTEFHLICSNAPLEDGIKPLEKNALEAYVAASRIRQMVDEKFLVFDKKLGAMRPIEYRDIVVLMRNTKTPAPIFESVFEECGIPVYTEVGRSYLSSPEVRTVLAFLQIIDNPRQDIPLIAVMRSPIWGFSPDELADMRSEARGGNFFDAVVNAANNGNKKAETFLSELESLREKQKYTDASGLIHSIYYDYGYYAYSGSLSRGSERQANLRLLFERAAEFEHTKLTGLFSFMNYIETIRSQNDDLTPAKTFGDSENIVRIMTIHKSKGLEFPVVILADTTREFNMSDLRENILWNAGPGLAADYVDTKMRVRYPSLPRDLVAVCAKRELMSEEMRLLYVALTRAREKLIITATYKKTKQGLLPPVLDSEKKAKVPYIKSRHSFRDWIMAALLVHPSAAPIRESFGFPDEMVKNDAGFTLDAFVYEDESKIPKATKPHTYYEEELPKEQAYLSSELRQKLEYQYPKEWLGTVPVKISVSEAKRMQGDDTDYIPLIKELQTTNTKALDRVTGAEKGTVVHFVMQLINPTSIKTEEDVRQFVEGLKKDKVITKNQAEAVEPDKIFRFFESKIGKRLKEAKRVEREFSFYTKADIKDVYDIEKQGEVLLQGTMDCFFIEDSGRVVLLDFKTDNVKNEEGAIKKAREYAVQMKYYKKALSEVLQKEVDECYVYFLGCGTAVPMDS